MTGRPACLIWLPHSYTGRGPAESCVRIVEQFPGAGCDATLFVLRARKAVPAGVKVVEGAGPLLRRLPYRFMHRQALNSLKRRFIAAVDRAEPGTIAWFWPDVPTDLVRRAKSRGLIAVREMINSPLAHAKPILDSAYRDTGLEPAHGITEAAVAAENEQLRLYDRIFASNPEVEKALCNLGIEAQRILPTTFGWVEQRFAASTAAQFEEERPFRTCFVGLMNVRKGVPTLLEAWEKAGIDGELWLAGSVEPCLQPLVEDSLARCKTIRHFGHVDDIGRFYRSCDLFVFPTHEEGGPQVTYEAAACGIAVVTTPMGAARLVRDGVTGWIVPPGDVEALAKVMSELAAGRQAARGPALAAQEEVGRFGYRQVGADRARQLLSVRMSCRPVSLVGE